MMVQIFSIYDSKAGAYTQPFFAVNSRVAVRMFSHLANDPKHAFGMNPEDFTLFELGCFDDQTGKIDTLDVISSAIGKAIHYKRDVTAEAEAALELGELPEGVITPPIGKAN